MPRLLIVAASCVVGALGLQWLRHMSSVVMHRLSCPMACGFFLDQESNPSIGMWILNHWTDREVPVPLFLPKSLAFS